MIIAIDGPAGAGKSTTARALAERFGYAYIDTGAMYRAVALAVAEANLQVPTDNERIAALARTLPIALKDNGQRIYLGEREVTALIRTPEIGALTSKISALPEVRHIIVQQQRDIARRSEQECGGAVLEGRDIQTVVFPDAPVKIFLTADLDTRAQRRLQQWQEKGEAASSQAAQQDITARDNRDSTREVSPLQAAPDAEHISTDALTPEQVVERIAQIVQSKLTAQQVRAVSL
ncbi:MAG: (d)CMP kinase [Abitibacteriaceae bacterium]|nr:(d)CMP kinase [Abditibacteriaceae bacterium]